MKSRLLLPPLATLAMALAASAAVAQTGDADALAGQLRIIAAQPTNVDALAQAGELSARLGDLSGAASLFARADKADPRNGRVKAGMAEVLLRSERPGEALQYYNQAEGYGYPVARFAAERGLAYDLVGQQGRAQRDYRTALAAGNADAELTRRYALSLAISGQKDAALQLLDPLTRRNDRGAWRARAFVLAMAGDVAGADAIATTMMPAGQSQGLAPFFARLPTLGPVDRAFAVHYGEVRPTPQRLADARLAPALPPLAPEIVPATPAASATALATTATTRPGAKARGSDRRLRGQTQVAAATLPPVQAVASAPLTAPARPTQLAAAQPQVRPASPGSAYYLPGSMIPHYPPRSAATAPAKSVAAVAPDAGVAANGVSANSRPGAPSVAGPVAPAPVTRLVPAAPALPAAPVALAAVTPAPRIAPPSTTAPQSAFATPTTPTSSIVQPFAVPPSAPASVVTSPASADVAPPVSAVAAQTPPSSPETDAILARIVGALAIPARELAEAGERAAAAPAAAPLATPIPRSATAQPTVVAEATPTRASRREIAATAPADVAPAPRRSRAVEQDQPPAAKPADETRSRRGHRSRSAEPEAPVEIADATTGHHAKPSADGDGASATPITEAAPRRGRHGAQTTDASTETDAPQTPAERRAARKATAEKKAAADKKAQAEKEAAEERRAAKAEPQRYWVQVAGGANEGDLPKAWASAKDKSAALAGKKGWTTPLRATNRVLAGPFKTDEEARSFVNTLKKQGLPAFQFTSDAGQKISRLDGK